MRWPADPGWCAGRGPWADIGDRDGRRFNSELAASHTPFDEVKWLGEDGWCPVCHSKLMLQGKPHCDRTGYAFECSMCGTGGSFEVEDGNTRFIFAEDGLEHCRIFTEGRYYHLPEMAETHKHAFQNIEAIRSVSEKYKKFALAGISVVRNSVFADRIAQGSRLARAI